LGDKDCPKNAHMVADWEDLDEEARIRQVAINTSIIDQDDLGALLSMANLADRDFAAEKQNIRVIEQGGAKAIQQAHKATIPEEMKQLPIPTRPPWNKTMSAEKVDRNERESFFEWRRGLAQLEEKYDACMTPFEKNLEFWRQLWRVVEKSDVVVQVS
jgi:large subunit GTPase 1